LVYSQTQKVEKLKAETDAKLDEEKKRLTDVEYKNYELKGQVSSLAR